MNPHESQSAAERRAERRRSPLADVLVFAALIAIFLPRSAYGYIDPGVGAMLWQGALAALFGGLFYARRGMDYLRTRFRRTQPSSGERSGGVRPDEHGDAVRRG
jgi:hypothetical protein